MIHLDWGDIATVLTSIGSIFAGVRWLLGVYFKQQQKLDAARKLVFHQQTQTLQGNIDELKSQIRLHRAELRIVADQSEKAINEFSDSKVAAQRVFESLKKFVESTEKRFEKIENGKTVTAQHHHPADEIEMGKVTVSESDPEKLGKVIVKK